MKGWVLHVIEHGEAVQNCTQGPLAGEVPLMVSCISRLYVSTWCSVAEKGQYVDYAC